MKRFEALDLEDGDGHARRDWVIHMGGFLLMAAIVAAAAVGVFGDSPMSRRDATLPDGTLAVNYDRAVRWHANTTLDIRVSKSGMGNEARISINQSYFNFMKVAGIVPEPARTEATQEIITFFFNTAERDGSLLARFYLEPEKPGEADFSGSLADGPAVNFRQRIFP